MVTRSPSVAYGASSLPEGAYLRETVEMFTNLWYNKLRKAVIQFDQFSTYEKVFRNQGYSTSH